VQIWGDKGDEQGAGANYWTPSTLSKKQQTMALMRYLRASYSGFRVYHGALGSYEIEPWGWQFVGGAIMVVVRVEVQGRVSIHISFVFIKNAFLTIPVLASLYGECYVRG
jgi:hypothetical protein